MRIDNGIVSAGSNEAHFGELIDLAEISDSKGAKIKKH